jgi:hypothetical protein
MLMEGRRQWIKKFLGGIFGLTGLTTLGSAISSEEAQAIARSVLPNSTMLANAGPCNFSCPSYCPNVNCPNCYMANFTCSPSVGSIGII